MIPLAVFILLWTGLMVNSEIHSLTYIYTAFSKPVNLPGIHDFTGMGLLDNRMIDYYDSDIQKKVPKQSWMKARLDEDYWKKGTQSRQSKHQWFKVNMEILMKRMRQNESDVHILQWMHGCKGEEQPDGMLKFIHGKDMYSYDGQDFLSFDNANAVWVAPVDAAVETKRKWDEVRVIKEYTKGYLENECMEWLTKFIDYGKDQLRKATQPEVYVFAQNTKVRTSTTLTCLATGLQSIDVILLMKRDGHVLTRQDRVESSGVRPNEDDTYQRRDHVEIFKNDMSNYTCHVIHRASNVDIEVEWVQELTVPEDVGNVLWHILVIVAISVGVLALAVVFIKSCTAANDRDNQNPRADASQEYQNEEDAL